MEVTDQPQWIVVNHGPEWSKRPPSLSAMIWALIFSTVFLVHWRVVRHAVLLTKAQACTSVGACAVTTKFLDNKIFIFKILLS